MSSSTELCLSEEAGQERGEHSQDGVVGRRQESLSLPSWRSAGGLCYIRSGVRDHG